jgi:predicted nucleic acid-binding protein
MMRIRHVRTTCEALTRHHGQLCISTITLMELLYGAEKSPRTEENLIEENRQMSIPEGRGDDFIREFERLSREKLMKMAVLLSLMPIWMWLSIQSKPCSWLELSR